ncbi:MAG: glycosyltransferase [Lachnospiraceae bacterium]
MQMSVLVKKALRVLKNEGLDIVLFKIKIRMDIRNIYKNWIAGNERNILYTEPLSYNPFFSVVVPVYNVADNMLRECIDSIKSQTYKNFEIVLVDDASTMESVRKVLAEYENEDNITVIYRKENGHISRATNDGINAAKGEFIALCDCDDLYAPNALYEMAKKLNENKDYDFIYSDEDKISEDGKVRRDPFFKPDWSPETFMSYMYTCHLSVYRKSLLEKLGGLRVGFEGSQDYDLVLRVMEVTGNIGHVPKILYHWRMRKESTANALTAKPYVMEATKKAKLEALERRGLSGELKYLPEVGQFRVTYKPQGNPKVSIVILSKDNYDVLKMCITSLFDKTEYKNFEVIVVDNGSNEQNKAKIEALLKEYNCKYIYRPMTFNFSAMCNIGAGEASGEYVLFMNDDIEVTDGSWLEIMTGQAMVPYTGAVGCKLYYPGTNRLQHAGVLNLPIGPGHCLYGSEDHLNYYYGRNILDYNFTAVTGACLMVSMKKFNEIGGFDEELPVAYNDVSLCFSLVEAGYYNVLRNDVSLVHHESISRGRDDALAEKEERRKREMAKLYEKHPMFANGYDPCYNPNLTPDKGDFSFNTRNSQKPATVKEIRSDLYKQTDDIVFNIENLAQTEDTVRFSGWAYDSSKKNNNHIKTKILLQDATGKTFEMNTIRLYRFDVATPDGRRRGLGLTGFETYFIQDAVPAGTYKVGIVINKKVKMTEHIIILSDGR